MSSSRGNESEYDPRQNPHKKHRGFKRIQMAACHSFDGFCFGLLEESAFRQELLLAALMLPWAFVIEFNIIERLLLVGSVILVLIIELVNSGIEAAVDRISFAHHSLSKRAKDYGSAAVLLALLLCGVIWISLLYSHINVLLNH